MGGDLTGNAPRLARWDQGSLLGGGRVPLLPMPGVRDGERLAGAVHSLRPCALALKQFHEHQGPDDGKYTCDVLRSLALLGMTFR